MSSFHSVGSKELAFDAGLRTIRRAPHGPDTEVLHQSEMLLCLARIGRQLTMKDIQILEAVVMAGGNQSAAARSLAPGRPSYRRYISRRLEKLLGTLRKDLLERVPPALS